MANNQERRISDVILVPSLKKLYEKDYFNIRNGVSERNICARLAFQMENIMREKQEFIGYYADVEYNRRNDGGEKCSEGDTKPIRMVSDLIIHRRDENRNLLAVEMKRWKNYDKRKDDIKRLKAVVSSPKPEFRKDNCVYDTKLGAFIKYSPQKVEMEFYAGINGEGQRIGIMILEYRMNSCGVYSLEVIYDKWL